MNTKGFKFYFIDEGLNPYEVTEVITNVVETGDIAKLPKQLQPFVNFYEVVHFEFTLEVQKNNMIFIKCLILDENDTPMFTYSFRSPLMKLGDTLTITWNTSCIGYFTKNGFKINIGQLNVLLDELPQTKNNDTI